MKKTLIAATLAALLAGCQSTPPTQQQQTPVQQSQQQEFKIPFEKYTLENGLTVILHQDKSDPIVAMATIVHVGSSREKPGRTGFAHFFEHMAFNDSENVPQGANRKMIDELGGTRNGGTWNDGTVYYEVVPKDALEKLMWIDSDRLGFMINTVTEDALEREKQVVKNEKRQRVDNQPYGHTDHVIRKNLYPQGHPYNWTVIGDLEDLQAATLGDVKEFYNKYYGPENATLVIAGDIDFAETKAMVKRWFGEIKPGQPVDNLEPKPVTLKTTKKLYHLDTFAKLPELRITLPTVEQYHPDSYALAALGEILSFGKRAPLYKEVVENQKLAPSVASYQNSNELAGTFTIRVRGQANTDLDAIYLALQQGLNHFEENGFSDTDLQRIKARQETNFYNGISSVLNKTFQLATYQEYAGDPGFISEDIKRIKQVTKEDIIRVYNTYIKDKPSIITSFVPKTQPDLILQGSEKANVVEEQVVQGAEKDFGSRALASYDKTPTKYDRSEPALGETPLVTIPTINAHQANNGLKILNIEHSELPLVQFSLRIDGGAWLEPFDKLGIATLMTDLMEEGTKHKTPAELQDAIGLLGASISIGADESGIYINGNSLARNYPATMALVSEILLEPRWDAKEFERLKQRRLTMIQQSLANPFRVAFNVFNTQTYGDQHRAGLPTDGTIETLNNMSLEDLKAFYNKAISPKNAALHVVGDLEQPQIMAGAKRIITQWQGDKLTIPTYSTPKLPRKPTVYFVDIPDAKQSAIVIGKPTISGNHADFYNLSVAQNRLGSGGSARLNQKLRIEKGYTYGAGSRLRKQHYQGPFFAYSQVRTNVTLESLQIFQDMIANYDETLSQQEWDVTKNLLVKQNTRRFETLDNLINMLDNISAYELPHNYIELEQQELTDMSLADAKAVFAKYADEQQMIYVVVGDAKTQLERVKQLGYGDPIMVDRQGKRLQ